LILIASKELDKLIAEGKVKDRDRTHCAGGGGITALHVQSVFQRLGIAEQVTSKDKRQRAGRMAPSACWWRAAMPRSGHSSFPN
jgi:hypothetical protein